MTSDQLSKLYPVLENQHISLSSFGEGLIHETFMVECTDHKYILQGFNDAVFQFPDRIDHNLSLLYTQVEQNPLPFQLPLPILNRWGSGLSDCEGKKYRLFEFVQGKTLQQIDSLHQAFLAAQAYGEFADWAKVIDAHQMQETIPNFHRLDLRYEKLVEVTDSSKNLNEEESGILDFYLSQKPLTDWYLTQLENLPLRVMHNDTKINNLIFSKNLEKVEALIDLDTLMGGYLMYDFGDLVRTVACSLPETATQWDSIQLIPEVFSELLKGYWDGIKGFSTLAESRSILLGGEVMTLMMGLRFFTDHLQGNIYYRVSYPEQNFHRAKNQMIFLQSQQEQRERLNQIWEKITGLG
ncbi:Ser/Thr protein kinase RdoA (MazF antagonist) [Algoriphagus aquaeductus]|uniref:Ser/Thr protein kinase RdoA (MazF antagonist) n=1 Tax=Algoriphagus aquaeductus TaxID=475299 RepID=A0A326RN90_9BACT|nr:aminoglycoside phosphotransferase family protein [Algoriphagus aquaeductus]PZV80968.1 Ser/Thr protein kinase RdoA (MazF antagonist) [Algoriphagus aquaeductus]